MATHFNLADKEWIPCIMRDGSSCELGILETLLKASDIKEIFDPSPLVTAALYRLLLAILHRNFGPASVGEWKTMWKTKCFDRSTLQEYFDKWYSRFDLFDEEHPFYQSQGFVLKKKTPLKRLAFEYAAQNNPTLFDHSTDDNRPCFPAKTAALWLVTNQSFAPTAGKSSTIHTKDSPWSRGAVILVNGDNLFQTLMLNLIPSTMIPQEFSGYGKPVWELDANLNPEYGVIPKGYLDYMTIQSRAISLIPSDDASGATCVSECYYAQGRSVTENLKSDPLLAYRVDTEKGNLVWQLRKDRAVWRDSSALLSLSADQAGKNFRPALSINLLHMLVAKGVLNKKRQSQLNIYGQNLNPGQPNINFWRHERLPLPLNYFADESLVEDLQTALNECEEVRKVLRYALRGFAKGMLAPPEGNPDKDAVTNLVDHLGADRLYWSRLETHFYRLLGELPNGRNEALDTWADTLRHTCWDCFEEATRDLDGSARTLRSIVEARRRLGSGLKRVLG